MARKRRIFDVEMPIEGTETFPAGKVSPPDEPAERPDGGAKERPARREIDRRFVYIDPSPGIKIRLGSGGGDPGFFQTILGALSDLPRQQPLGREPYAGFDLFGVEGLAGGDDPVDLPGDGHDGDRDLFDYRRLTGIHADTGAGSAADGCHSRRCPPCSSFAFSFA